MGDALIDPMIEKLGPFLEGEGRPSELVWTAHLAPNTAMQNATPAATFAAGACASYLGSLSLIGLAHKVIGGVAPAEEARYFAAKGTEMRLHPSVQGSLNAWHGCAPTVIAKTYTSNVGTNLNYGLFDLAALLREREAEGEAVGAAEVELPKL